MDHPPQQISSETKNKKNIWLLGLISFFNDISSEMLNPVLPLLIASLGGGGIVIGIVGGIRDSVASILGIIVGHFSDKVSNRKIFVFFGYFISVLFKACLAFSTLLNQVLIFSSLERLGKGVRTAPRDTIISDTMPAHKGKGFGIHRAMDNLGAVCGSIIAFLLLWKLGASLQNIILIATLIGGFALLPLIFVKEIRIAPITKAHHTFQMSLRGIPKEVKFFIAIAAIFACADISTMFFLFKAQTVFTGKAALILPLLLYIIYYIGYTVTAVPAGILADKIGKKRIITIGYLLFVITSIGFAFATSLSILIMLFALYGIAYAMIDGSQVAYVADLSTPEARATSLGAFQTVTGITMLGANLFAGMLWHFFGAKSVFLCIAAFALLAGILLMTLKNKPKI